MMSAESSRPPLRSKVVVYENQRFWVGGGFSKRGLLPAERGPYSTDDGSVSFKTLKAAAAAAAGDGLLGPGWDYDEGDEGDVKDENGGFKLAVAGYGADDGQGKTGANGSRNGAGAGGAAETKTAAPLEVDDGWWYSVDFSPQSLRSASPARKAQHFVRRRRWVRTKIYRPEKLLRPPLGDPDGVCDACDHCDTDAVYALSDKLIDCLAVATLVRENNPGKNEGKKGGDSALKDAVVWPLKEKLIEELDLGKTPPRKALPPQDFVGNDADLTVSGDALMRLKVLCSRLDVFSKNQGTALSRASQLFNQKFDEDVAQGLEARRAELECRYFSKDERSALVRLAVKRLDPEFNLHCNRHGCGEDCEFYPLPCPHNGCHEVLSQRHHNRHDAVCRFKVIPCPKSCGDFYPRHRTEVHLRDVCSLRNVKCPFHNVGCTAVILAKDVPPHLKEFAESHLLLTADRLGEQRMQVDRMSDRISGLERDNAQLRKWLRQSDERLGNEVKEVDKKLGKVSSRLTTLERRCNSEFRSHVK